MALRTIMQQIVTIESGLSIASPMALSSPRAYLIAPRQSVGLTDKVVFMNWPDTALEKRMGGFREDNFTVMIDCLVNDSDSDRAADIALAFFDAAWVAFDGQRPAGQRLGSTVDFLELRADRPMLEILEWNNRPYPGFHMFLDLTLFEASP